MPKWILTALIVVMGACTHHNNSSNTSSQKRDKEIEISSMIEEFDMGEIIVGKQAYLEITANNLYVFDLGSSEKMAYVFDATSGEYRGEGISYGPGPDEIGQSDIPTVFSDKESDKILMIDLAQWKIMQYDTDSMIESPDYKPRRLLKITISVH